MVDVLQREYERFGPWVLRIDAEEDVPQQFIRHKDLISSAALAFKIPVSVERRNVKKGMPLYNTVVALTEDRIVLLQRTKSDIDVNEIGYRDLQYFQHVSNILIGEIVLGTPEDIHVLTFNPVEIAPVEQAIRIIRRKYLDQVSRIDLASITEKEADKSILYESLIAQEFKSDAIKVIEYQPYMGLSKEEKGRDVDPEQHSRQPVLQDSLFLANDKELVVINRTKEIKLPKEADYGYRYTYIPLDKIVGVTLEPDEDNDAIQVLTFVLKESRVVFLVGHDFSVEKLQSVLKV